MGMSYTQHKQNIINHFPNNNLDFECDIQCEFSDKFFELPLAIRYIKKYVYNYQ